MFNFHRLITESETEQYSCNFVVATSLTNYVYLNRINNKNTMYNINLHEKNAQLKFCIILFRPHR